MIKIPPREDTIKSFEFHKISRLFCAAATAATVVAAGLAMKEGVDWRQDVMQEKGLDKNTPMIVTELSGKEFLGLTSYTAIIFGMSLMASLSGVMSVMSSRKLKRLRAENPEVDEMLKRYKADPEQYRKDFDVALQAYCNEAIDKNRDGLAEIGMDVE